MSELLSIQQLNIAYNDTPTVKDVSLAVGENQIIGIVGESGSGKSTLIRAVIGLLGREGRITSGSIVFQGRHLETMTPRQLRDVRGGEVAMIFQQPESSFDPIRTIGDQFCETMKLHERASRAEALSRADAILRGLGFDDPARVLKSYPFELSGGMCQRAAIAVGMACRPRLLLADEPTSALDVTVQAETVRTLMKLREDSGTSILLVTHNMGVIAYMADLVGVMYKGRIVEWGTRRDILLNAAHDYTRALISAIPKLGEPFVPPERYEGRDAENAVKVQLSPTHWVLEEATA
jgi:ABC-type dipeptide/oligopeptide/nickel transport system ATPase component